MLNGTPLPSQAAADDLAEGRPGALVGVVGSTLLRGGLIAAGLYASGERRELIRKSLYAAGAIEVFVLLWAFSHRGQS